VKRAQDANGIVVDQVGRDIGRARQARACQRCARPAALRKVELAPRGVGDPFVDMNGGTEAFGFGRAGIRPASLAMALTAWGPQAPPTRCPSGSSPTEIACQTKRSGVNPRAPRPVKRAPGTGAVIATPERRAPFPSAPGKAFLIPCAKDRYRRPRPAIPLSESAGLGEGSS
jgi:hypothetical protein